MSTTTDEGVLAPHAKAQKSVSQAGAPAPPDDSSQRSLSDETVHAEDLSIGDAWESGFREISGEDVTNFAELTGDEDPLHTDPTRPSPFGKPVAHGLLGLSVLAGLGTNHPKAATLALVSVEEWKFIAPVFFGDQVKVRNEIVELEPHGRRAVRVRWLRKLINESGRVVQEGYFVTLIASRSRNAKNKPR